MRSSVSSHSASHGSMRFQRLGRELGAPDAARDHLRDDRDVTRLAVLVEEARGRGEELVERLRAGERRSVYGQAPLVRPVEPPPSSSASMLPK
jgi:hypothetical protein